MNGFDLFAVVDLLYEKYLAIWQDVCNIESPTNNKKGVDEVGNYFVALAKSHGWKIEKLKQEVAGDVVCITMNPNAEKEPISLSGHIDTVHEAGSFGYPAVRVDEEKIYGPGVVDCKGGVVAGIMAMDALERCGFVDRPIKLLIQTDEEVGSSISNKDTINYICEKAKGSIAFLNLEGYSKGEACLERKGIVTYTFKIYGKSAHSSKCAIWGANAIAEAAYKIIELEKLKDHDGITCNCGVISGGTVVNTVPDYCEFKANFRFVNQKQLDWIEDFVAELANQVNVKGTTCIAEKSSSRLAMEKCDRNTALLSKMNEIFAVVGLPTLVAGRRTGGSDAAEVTASGIPCVDSIGVEGDMIHSVNEWAWLFSLKESAKRIVAIVGLI